MADTVIVLDTETTGLSPKSDRIVEIAAIEVDPRQGTVGNELYHLLNPMRTIPLKTSAIHGITDEKVSCMPTFLEIADNIIDFIQDKTVAIHNARFDVGMINTEFSRCGKPTLEQLNVNIIDTLEVTRTLIPDIPSHSLNAVCEHLGVSLNSRKLHGALIDVKLLCATLPLLAIKYDQLTEVVDFLLEDVNHSQNFVSLVSCFNKALHESENVNENSETLALEYQRIATISKALRGAKSHLKEFISLELVDNSWSSPTVTAKWTERKNVGWKKICQLHLPEHDLSEFESPSESVTVRCKNHLETADITRSALAPFCDIQNLQGAIMNFLYITEISRPIDFRLKSMKEHLIAAFNKEYTSPLVSISKSIRKNISYKCAVEKYATGVDLACYTQKNAILKIQKRDHSSCEELFKNRENDEE